MGLVINHNTSALQAHRALSVSNSSMSKSIEKLSSGYKINVGADDPSGLIISEQLRSQIAGLERAVRNSSEASNLIGIAEGALNEMNEILKKMRSLAIHAANNGITSPEQIQADQCEMDSGIETINRIANTTRYTDQYLLNGSKELVYDIHTEVNDPMDHALLNGAATRVDQVFKRDGTVITVGFTGSETSSKTNSANSAQRAYFEADSANPLCQIKDGYLTANQQFTLTGADGSRMFSFSKGQHIGALVAGINNSRDSTGVGATLTFASDVRVDKSINACSVPPDYSKTPPEKAEGIPANSSFTNGDYIYQSGDVQVYGANMNNPENSKIETITMTPDAQESFKVGYNCDGDGKIYAKVVDKTTNSIEYYKDADCTMLIGKGGADYFAGASKSGIPGAPTQNLDGIFIELNKDNCENLDVFEIAVIGQNMDNMKDMELDGLPGWVDVENSVMSGVDLGYNTSTEGEVFYQYKPITFDENGNVKTFKIEAFTDSSCEPKYLVASSGTVNNALDGALGQTVRLESVTMEDGKDSGLNITLNLPQSTTDGRVYDAKDMPTETTTGAVAFTNLGMRLYTEEYGSAETIRFQNEDGELFYHYRESDNLEKIMVEAGSTVQIAGQDAKFSLNGAPVYSTGLVANTTTPDFSGQFVFNAGKLGETTLAVAGYENGKLFSKSTSLQGVEENEAEIREQRREFEPQAFMYEMTDNAAPAPSGLYNSQGQPVRLYVDMSQLDSSVEARIPKENLGDGTYDIFYDGEYIILKSDFINGDNAGTSEVKIKADPEALQMGITVTDPLMKGLFIKTDTMLDPAKSATMDPDNYSTKGITVKPGNVLLEAQTYATNPRTNTNENLTDFVGGMQFQLGNTEGDQDRTIYSIPSMSMSEMGRVEYNGKKYCIQDVLSGGQASLSKDPILAMKVVSQAVDDVSTLRARLGAFQANMLETNINSLEVAIENITKTESAIRDSDMAAEMTEFTRYQIMQQAGTSMLAQANQISQNVLSLLQ